MTPEQAVPLHPLRRLRYELTLLMLQAPERTFTLSELVDLAERRDLLPEGRPNNKVVSDVLRWERDRGRVRWEGRGRYRARRVPRATRWWMRACVEADQRATDASELAG